jgi:cell division protein ZapA (FtsZ GTPase activity inhibitor)
MWKNSVLLRRLRTNNSINAIADNSLHLSISGYRKLRKALSVMAFDNGGRRRNTQTNTTLEFTQQMKTVRVNIAGQDYNLRSEDEGKVRHIAESVDLQMRQLKATIPEPSTTTLSVLTALNIAEKEYDSQKQQTANTAYLLSELETMINFLRQSFQDGGEAPSVSLPA